VDGVGTSARHAATKVNTIVSIEIWLMNLTELTQSVYVANPHRVQDRTTPNALILRHILNLADFHK
jgi:hypothetical protein